MTRYLIALGLALACTVTSFTAFGSPQGFYIGGGIASTGVTSSDLDGKGFLVDGNATHQGNAGKLSNGGGLVFDIGYNFGRHFGLEYLESDTAHTASHVLEPAKQNAFLSTGLLGVRLSANMADHFDVFARAGFAVGSLTYQRFGHKGSFSPSYSPTSDDNFRLTGTGTGYGVGAEAVFGSHLGVGIGYTVYDITFDEGDIASERVAINSHKPSAQFTTSDVTVLYHF